MPDKLEPRKKNIFPFFLWKDITIPLKMLRDTKGEKIFNSVQSDPIETITCSYFVWGILTTLLSNLFDRNFKIWHIYRVIYLKF